MYATRHTLHDAHHLGWDNSLRPVLTVAPGSTIEFRCIDASGGQLDADSTARDVAALDFSRVNPVTGPVFIDGAEPGDALAVRIESFRPSGIGWTANIPGFGLLADRFTEPAIATWRYEPSMQQPAMFGLHARVPLKPFTGVIGNAPAAPGQHSVVPPRRVGGNLDIRDLSPGTVIYLPIEVPGALFSVGDTHAAQGDGEICGTAIESGMDVALHFDLIKDAQLETPRLVIPGPVTRHLDGEGYEVTTGIGPDLFEGARAAVMRMVDHLAATRGMDPVDAYMLMSVCGDLRISEIVDAPNWVVSFYFPRIVFA